MFNEKYKNDNEKIIASEELVGKTRTKMKAAVTDEAAPKRHFAFKGAVALATVTAVVCICMFGNILPGFNNGVTPPTQTAKSNNIFVLTAYAMEQDADGKLIQRQIEFAQNDKAQDTSEVRFVIESSGDDFKTTFYKNIGFKCEGKNIKNVAFSVDDGYFSKADSNDEDVLVGVGKTLTLSKGELERNNIILWGIDVPNGNTVDESNIRVAINVKAVVTFEDGEIQEKTVVYDTQKGTLVLSEK